MIIKREGSVDGRMRDGWEVGVDAGLSKSKS